MPPATRRGRGVETTRQIMKVLSNDNDNEMDYHGHHHNSAENSKANIIPMTGQYPQQQLRQNQQRMILCVEELQLYLIDLQDALQDRIAIVTSQTKKAKDAQKQSWVASTVKLRTSIKKMTLAEFHQTHEGSDLLHLVRYGSINHGGALNRQNSNDSQSIQTSTAHAQRQQGVLPQAKKRAAAVMATPAQTHKKTGQQTAPRTVQRGEAMFSQNGSPVDTVDAGSLIATVTKKRRTNNDNPDHDNAENQSIREGATDAVQFDIKVGDGQYISLPGNLTSLNDELKSSAIQQLSVLQDQMASLMAQLKH